MPTRIVQKNFFFSTLTHHPRKLLGCRSKPLTPNFSSFGSREEEGMQFEVLNFRPKIWIFCPL